MVTKERNIEVLSTFYVSEFHLEMIILPYIIKEIENNNEIIILTEKKLEKSVRYLISKLNINEEKKEKLLKLKWNNKNINKDSIIDSNINKTFFIIGSKKYIEQKNIEINSNKIKIVNCYDLEEVQGEISEIERNSDKILTIKGEE